MDITNILQDAVRGGCSDIFIIAGAQLCMKHGSGVLRYGKDTLMPADTDRLIRNIYRLADDRSVEALLQSGDDDFSFSVRQLGRFRCNAYKQRGSLAAVLRSVPFEMPDYKLLNIPETVMSLADKSKGLVLVTGPAGSGKSTTLACIIDRINTAASKHIITIEDPIEYLHRHKQSIVSQREVEHDTGGYLKALRAALRQTSDVILLGEMRDYETISAAMTAAETGQLVFSTLHTSGAANTINRIIDVFPSSQQQQIRIQLSMVLQAVVSQQLVPAEDGTLMPVHEIMFVNSAIRNLIRESKIHQIDNAIFTGAAQGMVTMDSALQNLYRQGKITRDTALMYSANPEVLSKNLHGETGV